MEKTESAGPVSVRSEIDVGASPRRVWAVLADIDQWPTWNPAVRSASIEGSLESDTSFRFAAGQGTYSCVLTDVDAPLQLSWRGHSMGVGHHQSWSVVARSGGSYVSTDASLSGVVARIWSAKLQQWLQGNLDTWVRLLKLEAEARSVEDDGFDAVPDAPAGAGS